MEANKKVPKAIENKEKIEGLGDVVAVVVEKTWLKRLAPTNCNDCKRRQAFLNRKFPIK